MILSHSDEVTAHILSIAKVEVGDRKPAMWLSSESELHETLYERENKTKTPLPPKQLYSSQSVFLYVNTLSSGTFIGGAFVALDLGTHGHKLAHQVFCP